MEIRRNKNLSWHRKSCNSWDLFLMELVWNVIKIFVLSRARLNYILREHVNLWIILEIIISLSSVDDYKIITSIKSKQNTISFTSIKIRKSKFILSMLQILIFTNFCKISFNKATFLYYYRVSPFIEKIQL